MDQPSIDRRLIWKTMANTNPRSWRNGTCGWTQLTEIVASILSLPPTNAAAERSFSKHAWIHSARRNRLTADRAVKLLLLHITSHCVATMCWIVEERQAKQTRLMVATARPTVETKINESEERCRYRK